MNSLASRIKSVGLSFWLIVVLPTFLAIVYFGLIASDRYVAVSTFVVRSPQKSASVSGLSAFLQNVGFSRSTDDSYVVSDYILSRDAMLGLDQQLSLRNMFSNKKADILSSFNPFGFDKSSENLYEYYKNKVGIALESSSSISTLTVRAYSAEDAFSINQTLLTMAENMVNQLNERGRQDILNSAEQNVQQAEDRVKQVSASLTQYRANNQIFDLDKQAQMQMQLVSKLQDQLILVSAQLAQVRAITPENPQIEVLQQREKSIRADIQKETHKVLGSQDSLNQKAIEYERLTLEKDFAVKQLASALATREQSKAEATKKQLYLERISHPQKPDSAVEPQRIKMIVSVFFFCMLLFGVFRLFFAAMKEHQD